MKIIIDSREQNPLTFRKSKTVEDVIIKKLNAGDYSIEGYENRIAFERKSPNDLFQTIGKGNKRFQQELMRTINYDYFAIIIECSFKNCLNKDFPNAHYSQMFGDVVVQILYTLKHKYKIDVIFCNDRHEAVSIIRHTFKSYLINKNKSIKSVCSDSDLVEKIATLKKRFCRNGWDWIHGWNLLGFFNFKYIWGDNIMVDIIQYIIDNPDKKEITINQLAEHFGVRPCNITRKANQLARFNAITMKLDGKTFKISSIGDKIEKIEGDDWYENKWIFKY